MLVLFETPAGYSLFQVRVTCGRQFVGCRNLDEPGHAWLRLAGFTMLCMIELGIATRV